ncbi:hypothetical protein ACWT_4932 [Actinoplanes sp. SE50]|nr:hypothetical protein ACPL_5062 [Actinoplanes sp. SE50/110]ATO84347.1 hypothetical protein ACWT_4932 [Actinoplanes sp. SE50]SLM01757.1 hypothetical protein ACSP50_4995 [Actinoplanes sp. SE50/110]
MERSWGGRERLLFLGITLVATGPAWRLVPSGSPVADRMPAIAGVALLVAVVLIFPVSWAVLARGRTVGRRVGLILVALVAGWSVATVSAGTYETPPSVDDFLRWHLVAAGLTVLAGAAWSRGGGWGGVRLVGGVVWVSGVAVILAVPVVGQPPVPPGAVLPDGVVSLPDGVVAAGNRLDCNRARCTRVITVRAAGTGEARGLARRIGNHLAMADGWRMRWYPGFAEPDVDCRGSHRLADPYDLCLQLRAVGEPDASVEVRLYYRNRHDPVYRTASQDSHIY